MTAYTRLCQREKDRATLASTGSLLGWDERTYLPPKGQAFRGEQLALIARLTHEQLIAPQTGELLAQAEAEQYPTDSVEAANLRGIRRVYNRAVKVPTSLIEALARATSAGQNAWEQAKKKDDYPSFKPYLKTILDLKREEAQAVGYQDHPYDALLDEFEPGASTRELTQVFAALQRELVPLIAKIKASGKKLPSNILERSYSPERQRHLCQMILLHMGFDPEAGRLDVTVHPFCSGIGPGDVRLTTRYNEHAFNEAFFGTLHEAGHGIYEQNLDSTQFGMPAGTACSLGIHESQSRLWENLVGRSRAFWTFAWNQVRQTFSETLKDVTVDQWYAAINEVRPSFIRIEADEATYNLHIILRFELEQALLTGDLSVDDLPTAWNDRFKKMFGLNVPNNGLGCLQDVHWSAGLIGYFPTYTLGNLYAAQFMEQARRDLGDLEADFARSDFARLRGWLTEKIHRHGQRYTATDLCQRVTGKPLSTGPLMTYLNKKFGELYGISS
jgi:carboxypeptidase Taq